MTNKKIGNSNERLIDTLCWIYGIHSMKIPDGCKWLSKYKIIPVKSPFDRVWAYKGKTAFLDYKHSLNERFARSSINTKQVDSLLKFEEQGLPAGYLIFFQTPRQFVYYKASVLKKLPSRKSLTPDVGLNMGTWDKPEFSNIWKD